MNDLQRLIKNLKARYRNFNRGGHGFTIDLPQISSMAEYNRADRAHKKAKDRAKRESDKRRKAEKFNIKKNKVLLEAKLHDIKVTPSDAAKIKGTKTLNKLINRIASAKRNTFLNKQIRFQRDIRQYHANLNKMAGKMWVNKYNIMPQTEEELKEARKHLNLLKKGKYDKVAKLLKVKEGDTLNDATMLMAYKRRIEGNHELQSDIRYYDTAVSWVGSGTKFPELVILFEAIGVAGVITLAHHGFGISEYIDSDGLIEGHDKAYIVRSLEVAMTKVDGVLREKCEAFLARYA